MSALLAPLHLLELRETLADDLVHCRFHKRGRDRLAIPPMLAVVGNERLVGLDVRIELVKSSTEFRHVVRSGFWVVQETERLVDFLSRPHHVTVPQVMLHAFQQVQPFFPFLRRRL